MINRRGILIAGGAGITAAGSGAIVGVAGGWQLRQYLSNRATPFLDYNQPGGILTKPDLSTMTNLGHTVSASKSLAPDAFWHEFINQVTKYQNGYLDLYGRLAALLNDSAQNLQRSKFTQMSRNQCDAVLRELLDTYSGSESQARRLEAFRTTRLVSSLRELVIGPMLQHYYRSSYGWRVVGYSAHPGIPQPHLLAYTEIMKRT